MRGGSSRHPQRPAASKISAMVNLSSWRRRVSEGEGAGEGEGAEERTGKGRGGKKREGRVEGGRKPASWTGSL
eukprot:210267-Hanusia_phi.AAC.2